jgi:sn-glycerol 3-phosphate transport system permease protein
MALVAMVLAAQLVLVTLAAYAFARFEFPGRNVSSRWCWCKLMVMPDVLIVENYQTMSKLGIKDTILGDRAAVHGERVRDLPPAPDVQDGPARARRGGADRGLRAARVLWKVYVPLARPCTSPMRSSASATTGTISSGRSSSRIRWSRGR